MIERYLKHKKMYKIMKETPEIALKKIFSFNNRREIHYKLTEFHHVRETIFKTVFIHQFKDKIG